MARSLGDGPRRLHRRDGSPLPVQSAGRRRGCRRRAAGRRSQGGYGLMWKFLLPFAAFVALAVLFAFGLNPNRDIHALPSPLIGKAAPLFKLTDVMDPARTVSNAALKGQM